MIDWKWLCYAEFQELKRKLERKRPHENETDVNHSKTRVIEKDQETVALRTELKDAGYVSY